MLKAIILILIGFIIGGMLGIFTMAIITAGSEADDLINEMMNKHKEENTDDR